MRLWRRLTASALVALALVAVPATASAAPDQDPLDEVVSALDVARKPSDYVIVVDTSGSMTTDGRYAKVKTALRSLLKELKPDDHVSLVTFDTDAKVLYRGNISKGRYGALEALPVTPTGDLTDIGAGISAGLGELEAPGAKDLGALVLITDGKLDTAEGSAYRTADSAGWKKLRERAEAISAKHQIAGYAIALESAADAALLKRVLPKATDIPAKNIDERLSELDSALVRFQAAQRLQPDLEHGVEASWSGELADLPESGGSTSAEVTLTSSYERIPVEVSDLTVSTTGGPTVTATGLPDTVTLKPGESQTIPVELAFDGGGSGQLVLSGEVSSPWKNVMTKTLGLDFAPTLKSETPISVNVPTPAPTPSPSVETPAWLPGALLGIVVALAATAGLLIIIRNARPTLVGSLAITRDGAVIDEFVLTGRSHSLAHGTTKSGSALSGKVTAMTKPNPETGEKVPGVQIRARVGDAREKTVLFDGDSLEIGDVRITYTSARTRMISLINHP